MVGIGLRVLAPQGRIKVQISFVPKMDLIEIDFDELTQCRLDFPQVCVHRSLYATASLSAFWSLKRIQCIPEGYNLFVSLYFFSQLARCGHFYM